MRDAKGRFVKGQHGSPATEFKVGQRNWRPWGPYRDSSWLYIEYVGMGRSAADIAQQFGITEAAILFWLRKHSIERRDMVTIRKVHKWGLSGEKNGMYGKRGAKSPVWKGGITPERQAFYRSEEWREVVKFVWERDKYRCQRCGIKKTRFKQRFHIHHCVSFAFPDFRSELDYLVLLCDKCHYWVHSGKNVNREWLDDVLLPEKGGDAKNGNNLPRGE